MIGWIALGWSGWLYEIVPGFAAAMLAIVAVSWVTKSNEIQDLILP